MKSKISNEVRTLIINNYQSGKSVKKLSLDFNLKYQTINSIIKVYKEQARTNKLSSNSGRKVVINEEMCVFIKNLIDDKVGITLKEIQGFLIVKFNASISLSTIDRSIESFHYTLKRDSVIPESRNTEANIIIRREYARAFMLNDLNRYIFIDEMGVSCSMRKSYGRSEKGSPARMNVKAIRSKNISVCAAMSKNGMLGFESRDGAYNGEEFLLFMKRLLLRLREQGISNRIFVMDNVASHKMGIIRDAIESEEHSVLFLPPYSPQLNPIEEVYSKWKGMVKNAASRNFLELESAIQQGFNSITPEDCNGFFIHMMSFISISLQGSAF